MPRRATALVAARAPEPSARAAPNVRRQFQASGGFKGNAAQQGDAEFAAAFSPGGGKCRGHAQGVAEDQRLVDVAAALGIAVDLLMTSASRSANSAAMVSMDDDSEARMFHVTTRSVLGVWMRSDEVG